MASLEHVGSIARRMVEEGTLDSEMFDILCRVGLKVPGASNCDYVPIEISTCSWPQQVEATCRWTALLYGFVNESHGPADYGVLINCSCGCLQVSLSSVCPHVTSTQAEYLACVAALKWAVERKAQSLTIITDLKLLVRHLRGKAPIESPKLRPLLEVAQAFASLIPELRIKLRHR